MEMWDVGSFVRMAGRPCPSPCRVSHGFVQLAEGNSLLLFQDTKGQRVRQVSADVDPPTLCL